MKISAITTGRDCGSASYIKNIRNMLKYYVYAQELLFSDTPFLQLPILEYHGRTLCQSISIARFLAKKTKIYGKDEFIQAKVDAVVDYLTDYNNSKRIYMIWTH